MTEPSPRDARVVVVDDHVMFAQVVAFALAHHGFDATNLELSEVHGRSLLPMVLETPPDVLLLDLDLGPYGDGSVLIEPAVRAGVEVVVLTQDEGHDRVRALEAGARCTIPKTAPLADLIDTLERLLDGDTPPSAQN